MFDSMLEHGVRGSRGSGMKADGCDNKTMMTKRRTAVESGPCSITMQIDTVKMAHENEELCDGAVWY